MICLPDVNLWIALTSDRHVHHSLAKNWLSAQSESQIAFCRITELGFLRLLTNAHVMGVDVLSPQHAWRIYDAWRMDPRVLFLEEPPGFSAQWRFHGEKIRGGPNAWTDAFLATFSTSTNSTVVTLDRRFVTLDIAQVIVLS
jgi:hypothetical protein